MIKAKELPQLTNYIEANLDAGAEITKVFRMAAKSYKDYKTELETVASELEAGRSLGDALYEVELFDVITIEQISAGEKSGRVGESLAAIGELADRKNQIAGNMKSALMLPLITMGFALWVTFFMMTYVVPGLVESYGQQASRGAFVEMCLYLKEIIGDNTWFYFALAFAEITLGIVMMRSEAVVVAFSNAFSGLSLMKNYYFAIWAALMSMLLRSGTDIETSKNLCEGLLPEKYASAVNRVFREILEVGVDYQTALDETRFEENDERYLIPEILRISLLTGGATGRMDTALKKSSDRILQLFNSSVDNLTNVTKYVSPALVAVPVLMIVYVFFDILTAGLANI